MPTILIATDDRSLNQILANALSSEGYEVVPTYDGKAALELAGQEPIDLIVLDIMLSRMDGFMVLDRLRADDSGPNAQVPALLLSGGRVSAKHRDRAERLGTSQIFEKPVPLQVLVHAIEETIKSPPRVRASRAVEKPQTANPLAGTFAELSFPELLHHMHGLRGTGSLLVTSGRKKKALQVRDGYPVAVKSNLVSECLGNYLVRIGRIEREQHEESVERLKQGEGMQGEILVAMELLSEEEVGQAIHAQALEKLYEVFSWETGEFRFEIGARLKRANMLAVQETPANLILEGVRSYLPMSAVGAYLDARAARRVGRAESTFHHFQDVALGAQEEKLLARADGEQLVSSLAMDDEPARRSLMALLVTELLALDPSQSAASLPEVTPRSRVAVVEAEAEPDADSRAESPRVRESSDAPIAAPAAATGVGDDALRAELTGLADDLAEKRYFDLLGVAAEADEDVIRLAYADLASRTHPDRFHNASDAVRKLADQVHAGITRAHETLSDPKRRKQYLLELRKGERMAAEEADSRRAIEAETEFQRGEAMLRQRAYEEALPHFGRALEKVSEEGEYHAHYGWCLHLCHPDDPAMIEEAIEHVRRGVKLARDREKPYLYLGRLYKVVGRAEAAEKMFTRALQIRPECVEAMRELRLINLRREKGRGLMDRLLRKFRA